MSDNFDAVVAGHICLDVIPDLSGTPAGTFQRTFAPGRLVEVGPIAFSTGGPVSNTGLALNKLGVRTLLMGKVGDDAFGHTIRDMVAAYDPHLADGMVVDAAARTSYTVVINPPQIDRIFLHFAGANDTFTSSDVRYDVLHQVRLMHFGYPPIMRQMYSHNGAELAAIFRQAKATGVTTSLDMSLPPPNTDSGRSDWRAILTATLPNVDVFLPSGEEVLFMLRRQTYDELWAAAGHDVLSAITPELLTSVSDEILEMGVKVLGIKLGHHGFYLRTGSEAAVASLGRAAPPHAGAWANQEMWAPAFRANEVGATGSGDSSIAGFLAALLAGLPPAQTLTAATAVGACNVEAADALSGIRSWEATWQRINAGWPKHELALQAPGWRWDDRQRLWLGRGQ